MIDSKTANAIQTLTRSFWSEEVRADSFRSLAQGKEIGHRIADRVDEQTTELLEGHFRTARQRDKIGRATARSMGDIWVLSNGIYNPVNVKAGEANKQGQPNMVALNKLVSALLDRQIDSYYLLFVKFLISPATITPRIYFVDILDYLQYLAFDSGPGQLMLKERQFYEAMSAGARPTSGSLIAKIDRLISLRADAFERLIKNRAGKLEMIKAKRAVYEALEQTPIDQSGLKLA